MGGEAQKETATEIWVFGLADKLSKQKYRCLFPAEPSGELVASSQCQTSRKSTTLSIKPLLVVALISLSGGITFLYLPLALSRNYQPIRLQLHILPAGGPPRPPQPESTLKPAKRAFSPANIRNADRGTLISYSKVGGSASSRARRKSRCRSSPQIPRPDGFRQLSRHPCTPRTAMQNQNTGGLFANRLLAVKNQLRFSTCKNVEQRWQAAKTLPTVLSYEFRYQGWVRQ